MNWIHDVKVNTNVEQIGDLGIETKTNPVDLVRLDPTTQTNKDGASLYSSTIAASSTGKPLGPGPKPNV